MGVSVSVSLVIGIKSGELVRSEVTDDTFEIHDERGNPTGKFKTESTKTIYLVNEPTKKVKDEGYLEDITEILNIEEYPSEGDFGLHNGDYESRDYLQTGIVGIAVQRNRDLIYSGGTYEISLEQILDIKKTVQMEIYRRYGVNVEPSLFQVSSVG
jgi:hypothetical protein